MGDLLLAGAGYVPWPLPRPGPLLGANRMDSLSKESLLQVPVGPLRHAYHAQNRENQENSNLVCVKLQNQNMQNV